MRGWFAALRTGPAAAGETQPASGDSALAAEGCDPTPDAIRDALARILGSAKFDATPRSRRFLGYVVDETLAGRADRIKAFVIATDVFGRGADFDAHADPIVRLEAVRLRRALEQYYERAGAEDPIVISIPKGGYVPAFEPRRPDLAAQSAAPPGSRRWWSATLGVGLCAGVVMAVALSASGWAPWRSATSVPAVPRLLVRPFEDLSRTDAAAAVANGLTQEVLNQLTKFKDIVTVQGERDGADHGSRYVLMGAVSVTEDKLRLQARVLDAQDVSVLWARTYEAPYDPARGLAIEADLARRVATAVGQPYGVIYEADSGRRRPPLTGDWDAYACTLSYYAYRANLDQTRLPAVLACLENAVKRFPDYATAWGLLSQARIDQVRFLYPFDREKSTATIEQALSEARQAVELDPLNVRGLQAEMFALFFVKQPAAGLAVGKRALEINPNDTELMGEYGYRLALSGNWKEGCPMVVEARDRNPGPFAYFESALALCAYFKGDYGEAATWITRTTAPKNAIYHAIAAAIFIEAGQTADAAREVAWLKRDAPSLVQNVRRETSERFTRAEDAARFLDSLQKAGLDIGS